MTCDAGLDKVDNADQVVADGGNPSCCIAIPTCDTVTCDQGKLQIPDAAATPRGEGDDAQQTCCHCPSETHESNDAVCSPIQCDTVTCDQGKLQIPDAAATPRGEGDDAQQTCCHCPSNTHESNSGVCAQIQCDTVICGLYGLGLEQIPNDADTPRGGVDDAQETCCRCPPDTHQIPFQGCQPISNGNVIATGIVSAPSVYAVDGCGDISSSCLDTLSDVALAAIRCCKLDTSSGTCFASICSKDGNVLTGVATPNAATYLQASDECAAHGARLCTLGELTDGECCGSGCKHDSRKVWSNTPC